MPSATPASPASPTSLRRVALLLAIAAASTAVVAQDPAPLPPAARASGAEIDKLDAATVNIDWEEARVADLPRLARLPALRRLQINPDSEGGWQNITADDLAPLAALAQLEVLTIPYCAHLTAEHLQRLADCKKLASVDFINEAFTLDAAIAAALVGWPALRELKLSLIRVTPDGFAALAKLPHLERLDLHNCRDLDAAAMAAVAKLPLRSLALAGVGRPDMLVAFRGGPATPTWGLDVPTMKLLAAMPKLRELEILECELKPHLLAELPAELTALKLGGWMIDAGVVADLRRLGGLRDLSLRAGGTTPDERAKVALAAAAVVGGTHIERLCWFGAMPTELRGAIAGLTDLRELDLPFAEDLAYLARLPRLEHLQLRQRFSVDHGGVVAGDAPTAAELQPLRASRSLRTVVLCDFGSTPEDAPRLRKALGPSIELQLR